MKICAIVITYFPSVSEVIANIKQYIDDVNFLIIWENTPLNIRQNYKISIPGYDNKIVYMSTDKNEGIAYPINRSIEWAVKHNCTHILTMDQDSYWVNFNKFVNLAETYEIQENKSVLTPNINNHYHEGQNNFETVSFITSGTLFPLSILLNVGKFNEALFVEGVDLDYSLRVIKNEIKIITFPAAHLQQNFGYPIKSKLLNYTTSNYSAERSHNIVKNHILIYRDYSDLLSSKQKRMIFISYTFGRLIKVVLSEKDKYAKIKAILKGLFMGLTEPLSNYFK